MTRPTRKFVIGLAAGLMCQATARGQSAPAAPVSPPLPPSPEQPGATPAGTDAYAGEHDAPDSSGQKRWKLFDIPESTGLEIDGWTWFADLQNNQSKDSNSWDAEVSLSLTQSFGQRVAISAEVNAIDANGYRRAELEQGFLSARLSESGGSLVTIGKFNAGFGVEGRDFWDRVTGTPSLLFGAQPQDLVGAMLTLPIGDTGLKLRPFISEDFQGTFTLDQPPSGGIKAEYRPSEKWQFTLTNWVGPGLIPFGGRALRTPYPQYTYGEGGGAVAENWGGPNLYATRAGTLYFLDANAVFRPGPDLTLAAEYLMGTTGTMGQRDEWSGWMVMADYSITDRLHAYGRWSSLDDHDWLITGIFQRHQEVSVGAGYRLPSGVEVRGELRYDYSNAVSDVTSLSVHVTFPF